MRAFAYRLLPTQKEMPAQRPACGATLDQRSAPISLMSPAARPTPPPHEAGTWRGNDMAAAATSVASKTLRVHMFAS